MLIDTKLAVGLGAMLLSGCAQSGLTPTAVSSADIPAVSSSTDTDEQPSFAGDYNGNSFETAMGMRLAEDGTFQWGLSVGALDMRAKGTWEQTGKTITLTSDPKPVPPRFGWSGYEKVANGPLIKVVWASTGKPFGYASINLTCGDGTRINAQVPEEGWSPDPEKCAEPVSLTLHESIYEVHSEPFDLATDNASKRTTVRFMFERNDMGVADFTGMTGRMDGDRLKFTGGQGIIAGRPPRPGEVTLELRKLPAQNQAARTPETQD